MAREYKNFPTFETKILDEDQGIVEHTVAIMGNTDLGGDIIHPGAFTKTLAERGNKVRVVDQHNTDSIMRVIGKPLDMREVGRESLPPGVVARFPEASGALKVQTQYLLDTPEGRGAFERIKAGAIDEYSIGYDAVQFDYSKKQDGETVRNLRQVRLWEYSPVIFGMNPATSTLGYKTVTPYDDLPLADRAREWDAAAADGRVRAWANAEDAPNERYARAFMWHDADAADQFGAYKLGFADVVDGRLVAISRGLFAVAGVLQGARGGADIPEADQERIKGIVVRYYDKMRREFDDETIMAPWEKAAPESEAMPEAVEDTPMEGKSGRAISKANGARIMAAVSALKQAAENLENLLESAGIGAGSEEEAEEQPAPDEEMGCGTKPKKAAGAGPSETPTQDADRQRLLIELELLEQGA